MSSLRERRSNNAFTVSELNAYIKNIFDGDRTLSSVTVKGEISNFVRHRSGHLYFTLKDSDGQIKSVMFRYVAERLKFMPENGMKVSAHGSVSVYGRDGSYQLYINSLEPDGIGALYKAFEQLKEKLYSEGLFDGEAKKSLPFFPERIGVITSPTGAAVRDIINVLGRRFPIAKVYIYPSLVQGDEAPDNLIEAIDYFESSSLVDLIIIGRGGGSIEDLWAFNSEVLARKIYAAKIPVISAVGHETDFTICDFVADMRAPTPSAAAEIAVPDIRELIQQVDSYHTRLCTALTSCVKRKREKLDTLSSKHILQHPITVIEVNRKSLEDSKKELYAAMNNVLKEFRTRLILSTEKTNTLSPLSVLSRGYAIAEKNDARIFSVENINVGDELDIRLADGVVSAKVKNKRKAKSDEKKHEI
ncbi:MAG: exodeoxyribonuclease VII large subunit [Ruminococcaceae bacterium]|nr:exodeoxyribonuclease VII large subunit [Oscillospiraceae bacterium]